MTTNTREVTATLSEVEARRVLKELRARRKALGLTQREAAAKIGVSKSTLTQYEGGRHKKVWLSFVIEYAEALGCKANIELVDDDSKVAFSSTPSP